MIENNKNSSDNSSDGDCINTGKSFEEIADLIEASL